MTDSVSFRGMTDDRQGKILAAAAALKNKLIDELDHGYDTDAETAEATNKLSLIEQYEDETNWSNPEEVDAFAALVGVE